MVIIFISWLVLTIIILFFNYKFWKRIKEMEGESIKKKIKDCTFKEFNKWANHRACDGSWDIKTSLMVIECTKEVYRHFFKEKHWNKIKGEYFDLEKEIEV